MKPSELQHAADILERLREARAAMAEERFHASSDDGRITVTVDAAGYPSSFDFDPRAFRSPIDSEEIAATILDCCRRAREQADSREREALEAARAEAERHDDGPLSVRLEAMSRALLGNEDGEARYG